MSINRNKISYALFTPVVRACLFVKGIRTLQKTYWNGFPFISKSKGSTIEIGRGCRFASRQTSNLMGVNHRCMLSTSSPCSTLQIGDRCGFTGVTIWCFEKITLGNNVRVGANVTIMDGDAHQDDPRSGENSPITIEDNVWIGANTIVLKGVTIGRNTLIGAGSVVTKSIPANVLAAGNPCRVIRSLEESVVNSLESL